MLHTAVQRRDLGIIDLGDVDMELFVDGDEAMPFVQQCWWPLKKGSHRLQLIGMKRNQQVTSEPVTINVE